MAQWNAVSLQEILRQKNAVSVPWIQQKFHLEYSNARALLTQLIQRGWVEAHPVGIDFAVQTGNLRLRKVRPEEVDKIIEQLDSDCASALECLQEKAGNGVTFSDLRKAVRGDEDTKKVMNTLLDLDLIYSYQSRLYPCLSSKAMNVLERVARAKNRSDFSRRLSGKNETLADLRKMFDPLFEED